MVGSRTRRPAPAALARLVRPSGHAVVLLAIVVGLATTGMLSRLVSAGRSLAGAHSGAPTATITAVQPAHSAASR